MKYDHFSMLPDQAFQGIGAPGRKQIRLCGGGGSAPKPDPQIGVAQQKLADLAVRQQDWYENNIAPKVLEQMDQSLSIAKQQADKQTELQDYQLGLSKKYDERYWNTTVPLQDQLIAKARSYNEAAEQERMAGEAAADVEQATTVGGQALQRSLAMRGINAGSAGAISAMASMRSNADLAKAGAMNKTREAARQMGWARLGEAAALGQGLVGFGQASSQLSMGAGQAALGAGTTGLSSVGTASGINNSASQTAMSGWNQSANVGLGLYQGQLQAYNINQQSENAKWAAVGQAAGTAAMFAAGSDRRLKTDISPVGQLDNGLTVYRYRYKAGGPYVIGVMADEVEQVMPHAVIKNAIDGKYDAVRYDLLGV